jgi:CoA:oxalate CoA-transferase
MIYASISGFGQATLPEYAGRPSYDVVAQAYSGLMSITGPENGPPCRVGSSIGDIIAGHQAVIGILAALYYRTLTGRGQRYDGSMVDGLFSIMENAVVRYTVEGNIPKPLGTAHPSTTPFQAFPTRDSWIIIAAGGEKLWALLCRTLGRDDLINDARFRTNPLRTKNRAVMVNFFSEVLTQKTTAEWAAIFEQAGVPYSPVNNIKQICEDPQIKFREMLVEIEQKGIGKMKIAGSPLRLSETPGKVYRGAPLLGEHTAEILKSLLKKTEAEILALRKKGAIN